GQAWADHHRGRHVSGGRETQGRPEQAEKTRGTRLSRRGRLDPGTPAARETSARHPGSTSWDVTRGYGSSTGLTLLTQCTKCTKRLAGRSVRFVRLHSSSRSAGYRSPRMPRGTVHGVDLDASPSMRIWPGIPAAGTTVSVHRSNKRPPDRCVNGARTPSSKSQATSSHIAYGHPYVRLSVEVHRRADQIAIPTAFEAEMTGAEGIGHREVSMLSALEMGHSGANIERRVCVWSTISQPLRTYRQRMVAEAPCESQRRSRSLP